MNKVYILLLILIVAILSGCSTRGKRVYQNSESTKDVKTYSSSSSHHSHRMDKKTYSHPTMRPYVIRGIRYHPTVVSVGDRFKGNASWYGPDFHGKLTSNGEILSFISNCADTVCTIDLESLSIAFEA